MAIDMKCPHCLKGYRLKDDMEGKRVQCANKECRKPFLVTADTHSNGAPVAPAPAAAPPAPKPRTPAPATAAPAFTPSVDAEALAAAALNDESDQVPVQERKIKITCSSCDHGWEVNWSMQGKNVLCPDCRSRTKVPLQKDPKKIDWKDGGGRPSMAKVEELEGVQASINARMISGETARATGVIEDVYEARPISFYVKIASAVVIPLLVLSLGYVYYSKSKRESFTRTRFDKIVQEAADDVKPYPMYNAILHLGAAEYEARLALPSEKKDQLSSRDKSIRHILDALDDLKIAPKSLDRDYMLAELATVAVLLGGDGEALKEKTKLNWLPITSQQQSKASVKPNAAEQLGVLGQLRQIFSTMLEVGADFEARTWAARRVCRELLAANQMELAESFAQTGFNDEERLEADGQIGLEFLRAGKTQEARQIAERLASSMANPSDKSPSAHALFLACEPPVKAPSLTAPGAGPLGEATRLCYVALNLSKKSPEEAFKLANASGAAIHRIRALTLGAEFAEQPMPFLDAAVKVIEPLSLTSGGLPPTAAVRLACSAARMGADDKVDFLLKRINDEGVRAWAKAEALREKMAGSAPAVEESAVEVPTEEKKFKPGHAWARFLFARASAAKSGKSELEKQYASWPKPFSAFGKAGFVLGMMDASVKK